MYKKDYFINFLNNKTLSPRRKKQIIQEVVLLFDFLKHDKKPNRDDIFNFKKYSLNNFYISTAHFKFSCINKYLDFIKKPKINYKQTRNTSQIDYLSIQDYKKIRDVCDNNSRNKNIIETLFFTGIRISELSLLTVDDLKSKNKSFKIHSKDSYREIPIHNSLYDKLLMYCNLNDIKSGNIFLSNRNNPLSYTAITSMLSKIASKAKVKRSKVTNTHNFRRLFIKYAHESGLDIKKIKDIVGHNSVDTTYFYIKCTRQELAKDLNTFFNV